MRNSNAEAGRFARVLLVGTAVALTACNARELHRLVGVPEGTLVVGIGMPMREVVRRSTVKLPKPPSLATTRSYADDAFFDFEMADSALRFDRCWNYLISADGPDETVTIFSVFLSPPNLAWPAFADKMREAQAKLRADDWELQVREGEPTLEAFLARGAPRTEDTLSDVTAWDWRKGAVGVRLSTRHADAASRFWVSLDVSRE